MFELIIGLWVLCGFIALIQFYVSKKFSSFGLVFLGFAPFVPIIVLIFHLI